MSGRPGSQSWAEIHQRWREEGGCLREDIRGAEGQIRLQGRERGRTEGEKRTSKCSRLLTGRAESCHRSSSCSSAGWDPPARPAPLAPGPLAAGLWSDRGCAAAICKAGVQEGAWRAEAEGWGPCRGCLGCILLALASAEAAVHCTPQGHSGLRPLSGALGSPGASWGIHILQRTSSEGLLASPSFPSPVCSGRHIVGAVCHPPGPRRCVSRLRPAEKVWWSDKLRGACGRENPDPRTLPPGTSGWCPTLQSWSRTDAGLYASAGACARASAGSPGRARRISPSHWAWQTGFPHPESRGAPLLPASSHSEQSRRCLRHGSAGLSLASGRRTGWHCAGWWACGPWSSRRRDPRAPPRWWRPRLQTPQAGWGRPSSPVQSANSAEGFLHVKRTN